MWKFALEVLQSISFFSFSSLQSFLENLTLSIAFDLNDLEDDDAGAEEVDAESELSDMAVEEYLTKVLAWVQQNQIQFIITFRIAQGQLEEKYDKLTSLVQRLSPEQATELIDILGSRVSKPTLVQLSRQLRQEKSFVQ